MRSISELPARKSIEGTLILLFDFGTLAELWLPTLDTFRTCTQADWQYPETGGFGGNVRIVVGDECRMAPGFLEAVQ